MKIAILGNYTLDFLGNQLKSLVNAKNFTAEIHITGYNQYKQDILLNNSIINNTQFDIYIISLDLNILLESLLLNSGEILPKDLILDTLNENLNYIELLSNNKSSSYILIDNFCLYNKSIFSTLNFNTENSYGQIELLCNNRLIQFTSEKKNIFIVDVINLFQRYGSDALIDYRMYYTAKSQWSFFGLKELAKLYLRYIKAINGVRKKCIVLDLDNTLWGGIIGEDGMEGILLSNDGPGKSFYDFQTELEKLYNLGIILAINSKNSPEIALKVIEEHPYMVLRSQHFLVKKINWNNKIENIKDIAEEVNIGLDSIVYLDDSPFERDMIKSQFPQIAVPYLPQEPALYSHFLRNLDYFDFLKLTDEDKLRNVSYFADLKRKEIAKSAKSIEDFYYSLEMKAVIGKTKEDNIARIAQMTQKTNQFNLTTRRYNENNIRNLLKNKNYDLYFLRLIDKYGDNGIVALSIIMKDKKKKSITIDTFLQSCRVIGRTIEIAFLNYLKSVYFLQGFKIMIGHYIETSKNSPCKDFLKNNNFTKVLENWILDLNNSNNFETPWLMIEEEDKNATK